MLPSCDSFLSNLCNKSSWKCELDLGKGKQYYQKAESEDAIYESRYHNEEADDRARIEIQTVARWKIQKKQTLAWEEAWKRLSIFSTKDSAKPNPASTQG